MISSFPFPRLTCLSLFCCAVVLVTPLLLTGTTLTTEVVVGGLTRPVVATAPEGDFQRLFIVEQRGSGGVSTRADIRILDLETRTLRPRPFLSIASVNTASEEGLLGLAFHPDYNTNGYFFTYHTNSSGNNVVTRWQVSGADPDSADPLSATTILVLNHPVYSNHNGGWIGFGPDGYLYINTGDGGGSGDPNNNGQNLNSLLGKTLRLDIDSGSPYAVPPTNPFFGGPQQEEIFYWGLRNPWRASFDRETGEIYIADVGQNNWEEVNWRPANDTGNVNFGWRLKEGTHCFNPAVDCDPLGITTDPIHEYDHLIGCSITGGYVYRGCLIPDLHGTYFFGDYCSGRVWSFRYNGASLTDFEERTAELGLGTGIFGLASFGEDAFGEIYLLYLSGVVRRIVPATAYEDCNANFMADSCDIALGISLDVNADGIPDECAPVYVCGDADGNSQVTISDAVYLISFIFGGGPEPDPLEAGDADCSGVTTISDAVYLINFIFAGGPQPCEMCP